MKLNFKFKAAEHGDDKFNFAGERIVIILVGKVDWQENKEETKDEEQINDFSLRAQTNSRGAQISGGGGAASRVRTGDFDPSHELTRWRRRRRGECRRSGPTRCQLLQPPELPPRLKKLAAKVPLPETFVARPVAG